MPRSFSAFIDCPHCQSEIRLKRSERNWARCRYCGTEFDPSESAIIAEWQVDD